MCIGDAFHVHRVARGPCLRKFEVQGWWLCVGLYHMWCDLLLVRQLNSWSLVSMLTEEMGPLGSWIFSCEVI